MPNYYEGSAIPPEIFSKDALDPVNFGWKEESGVYTPNWFEGSAIPQEIFSTVGKRMIEPRTCAVTS